MTPSKNGEIAVIIDEFLQQLRKKFNSTLPKIKKVENLNIEDTGPLYEYRLKQSRKNRKNRKKTSLHKIVTKRNNDEFFEKLKEFFEYIKEIFKTNK